MAKIKITLDHDEPYSGFDGTTPISIPGGGSAEVSEEKAEQLLRDFPDRFKKGRQRNTAGRGTAGAGAPKETYAEYDLAGLRQIATGRDLTIDADDDEDALRARLIASDQESK